MQSSVVSARFVAPAVRPSSQVTSPFAAPEEAEQQARPSSTTVLEAHIQDVAEARMLDVEEARAGLVVYAAQTAALSIVIFAEMTTSRAHGAGTTTIREDDVGTTTHPGVDAHMAICYSADGTAVMVVREQRVDYAPFASILTKGAMVGDSLARVASIWAFRPGTLVAGARDSPRGPMIGP